jgi:hypothetical protein
MATFSNNLVANSGENGNHKYYCKYCDYKCSKKYNWDKHNMTSKHIKATSSNTLATEKWHSGKYCCEICGKEYNDRTGLWRHKKVCKLNNNNEENILYCNDKNNKLIEFLMKENKEIKEIILEIVKNGTMNNSHNTTTYTNSHNKAFNLNFFLNETCKNAMNITDFVDSIKLQLSDLMDVGELGYVDGISKIIVTNLNSLDETVRPIHCTDKKRETMYVKDDGEWEKEDEKKTKLTKVVKSIANKNIRLLPQFREKYPEYNKSVAKISDTYDKIVIESMSTDDDKNEKIIKNISKATVIQGK